MGSGKYSALSGAVAREQAMSNVAANLANVSTTGFKKDRISFAAILRGAQQASDARGINFARIRKIGVDFSQGGMQPTDRPLDVAIDGPGFFKVRKGGETFYTRSGRLMLDDNGMVKTEDGLNVLGAGNEPLQIDTALGKDIVIAESGDISVAGTLTGNRIQVFAVPDQDKLKKAGNALYALEEGGDQPLADYRVLQGSLETSNVNMIEEMTAMVDTQRTFEAHLKALESYSKLGEKQDELGSVS
ncbi:flagellar hook-basal body protein [Desulfobulbus propionicus DSM 2032]|jgi:flagellar basal-body rod protein FlgF/flagellar basal-body rod protein FlgG|uniref:Flagellar hook-basal body protein n=1 Tax=Desulfobulbus propionicus (strain ATCC 33891 / DSM 2032 / VKM B-1956 / 1pr3) TaxID=577650 RepID=A0A7U3YN22_DESPD|nr:flagellar basal-body rod protein FlgF [Desulfobulbus propionicus]ADW18389.1 flagellar hook-basal body protein [Desulfobulbus propionicus DSM 2032]